VTSSMDMFVPKHVPMVSVESMNAHEVALRDSILKNQRLENALAVLAREAGFSQETLNALRQAVDTGRKMKERGTVGGGWNAAAQNLLVVPSMNMAPVRLAARTLKPASSKRQQLTVEEAAEIYSLRPRNSLDILRGSMAHCRTLAPKYGVTPKTIRDVWSGRTWAEATRHLWTEEEVLHRAKRAATKNKGSSRDSDEDDEDAESENTNHAVSTPHVSGLSAINIKSDKFKDSAADKLMNMIGAASKGETIVGHPIPNSLDSTRERAFQLVQNRMTQLRQQQQLLL